jgi:hypothetical protein
MVSICLHSQHAAAVDKVKKVGQRPHVARRFTRSGPARLARRAKAGCFAQADAGASDRQRDQSFGKNNNALLCLWLLAEKREAGGALIATVS